MSPKYFYIVKFNKHMYEVRYTPAKIKAVQSAIMDKGWIVLKDEKIMTNSTGIEDIMTPEEYDNWIHTQRPTQYIKAGVWYDGKENRPIRYEPWKQLEIDEKKRLKSPDEKPMTPEEKKKVAKIRKEIGKKFGRKKK